MSLDALRSLVYPTPLDADRARRIVIVCAGLAFVAKVLIATHTYGTEDIHTWAGFALGVQQHGPVGVYALDFPTMNGTLYNHPPLIGYLLAAINQMSAWGIPLKVSLRGISSAADVVSSILVFEIMRTRGSLRRALLSALGVAISPQLLLISGYHGNTEPEFAMLVLLGSYLIFDKQRSLSGGIVLALAIGIKLVPVVVLPTVAVYLVRHRRDLFARAAVGFVGAFAITWGPAILRERNALVQNVFGYKGIPDRPWGPVRFVDALGWTRVAEFLIGPGSTLVVIFCALVPAALTWRRETSAMPSVALSLVAFLALSPAFGTHYLAWAVAAAYLLDPWAATVYNFLGGALMFAVYDQWNGGLPWTDIAYGQMFNRAELVLAAVLWTVVVTVLLRGIQAAFVNSNSQPGTDAVQIPAGNDPQVVGTI